jgi:ligand-binding SRPBCC domain-containing protein
MAAHSLKMIQKIPAPIEEVWKLFSESKNLAHLTPTDMAFTILSPDEGKPIYKGQVIKYKLKPLWGLTVRWVTEIGDVEQERFFMDIQRKGPYSIWEHRHYFKPIDGGVEMTDIVDYQVPLGGLGKMVNSMLVKGRLKKIFEYRFDQVEKLLGKWEGQEPEIEFN